jgi:hypothetical protein
MLRYVTIEVEIRLNFAYTHTNKKFLPSRHQVEGDFNNQKMYVASVAQSSEHRQSRRQCLLDCLSFTSEMVNSILGIEPGFFHTSPPKVVGFLRPVSFHRDTEKAISQLLYR